jgi:hypothetical protein
MKELMVLALFFWVVLPALVGLVIIGLVKLIDYFDPCTRFVNDFINNFHRGFISGRDRKFGKRGLDCVNKNGSDMRGESYVSLGCFGIHGIEDFEPERIEDVAGNWTSEQGEPDDEGV